MATSLDTLRTEGRDRFEALGFPSRRSEMWKYTDVGAIAKGTFAQVEPGNLAPDQQAFIDGLQSIGPVIVIQNGQLRDDLSSGFEQLSGVAFGLAADHAGIAQAVLENGPAIGDRQFAHLNAANMADPVLLAVERNTVVEQPVHLVFVNSANTEAHARIFVSVGENARATLLETHLGADGEAYFANPVTHIDVGQAGRLNHYRRQAEGVGALHVATSFVSVGRDATYEAFALSTGAELARHEIEAAFLGPGGDCTLSGAYVAQPDQHLDTTTRIDHRHPDCRSREVYHGAIGNKGRGVFQGSIYVHPEAQRTDGHQLNRAILLGPGAEIDAKPQLEIYADDVKCSHGCTAGQLDDQALFYLRSRGISAEDAKMLMINGFLAEAIEDISDQSVREVFAGHAQTALYREGLTDA